MMKRDRERGKGGKKAVHHGKQLAHSTLSDDKAELMERSKVEGHMATFPSVFQVDAISLLLRFKTRSMHHLPLT